MRYAERLSSLKLRISCFGLRKMQLLSLSPDYSKWFSFRLQLSFWRLNEHYRQFEHQEMLIRLNVANYSQFNAKTMFTTVHKSVLPETNSVVTSLSFWPIGVWKCLSSIKMQAINYERRSTVLLFFIGYFVHCTIWFFISGHLFLISEGEIYRKKKPTNLNLHMNISSS